LAFDAESDQNFLRMVQVKKDRLNQEAQKKLDEFNVLQGQFCNQLQFQGN
jgi:hypothetical protein